MKISALSKETVLIPVQEIVGGSAVDVTTNPVQIAFMADTVDPTATDWLTAGWEINTLSGDYDATIIVGPGGTVTLVKNHTYRPWVRVTTPDERPVLRCPGLVRVF